MILTPSISERREGRRAGVKGFPVLVPHHLWHQPLEGLGLAGADVFRGKGLGADFGSEASLHPALA